MEITMDKTVENETNLSISSSLSWREQANPKEEKKTQGYDDSGYVLTEGSALKKLRDMGLA